MMRRVFAYLLVGLMAYAMARVNAAEDNTPTTTTGTAAGAAAVTPAPALSGESTSAAEPQVSNELQRWYVKLRQAGITIPVQLFLSVLGLACILERSFMLRRRVIAPPTLASRVRDMWKNGRYSEIIALCESSRSTLGRMVAFIVRHRDWDPGEVSASAGDIGARELRRHLLRSYPLAVVGALAPLLGLLGTVSGMVDAFDAVSIAGLGDVQVLGSSISKALVTTLVGLVVAIPALFAYHVFKARTQLLGVVLEEEAAGLVHSCLMQKENGDGDANQA